MRKPEVVLLDDDLPEEDELALEDSPEDLIPSANACAYPALYPLS